MAQSSIVKTQQRLAQMAANAKTPDEAAQVNVQQATVNAGLPMTPSQQIMQDLMMQQQHQQMMQQVNMKIIAQAMQNKANMPAEVLQQQRAQLALQQDAILKQIQARNQQMELQNIMPKETVQDSEQNNYVDPNQLEILEKIYFGMSPKKKAQLQQLGALTQYQAPLRDYQGGFINPNYDKQMRPMGNETTKLTEF